MEATWFNGSFFVSNVSHVDSFLDDVNISTNQDNNEMKERLQTLQRIFFYMQYFLLPLFLVTGFFGNMLTIATMASRRFQHLTSRYILIFLAISDTVLLLSQPFNKLWVIKLFSGVDVRALSTGACKLFFVIFRSAKMTSSWLVVMLCFERFVAVVFPLKAKTILRKRFIFLAIAADYIFMFVYNGVWSFSSGIVDGKCKPDLPSTAHSIFVILGCSLYSFIPTCLLLIFTPTIIRRLIKQRNIRMKLSRASSGLKRKNITGVWGVVANSQSKNDDEMLRASVMVLGVMIAYIVLIIPITTVHLYSFIKGVSAFDVNSYGFFVYREIAQMLEQINYAVNFFFYILCSRTFRERVKEFFCFDECSRVGDGLFGAAGSSQSSGTKCTVSHTQST